MFSLNKRKLIHPGLYLCQKNYKMFQELLVGDNVLYYYPLSGLVSFNGSLYIPDYGSHRNGFANISGMIANQNFDEHFKCRWNPRDNGCFVYSYTHPNWCVTLVRTRIPRDILTPSILKIQRFGRHVIKQKRLRLLGYLSHLFPNDVLACIANNL